MTVLSNPAPFPPPATSRTSTTTFRILQSEPTEPPKSFLSGENPHLNGTGTDEMPGFPEIRHPKSEIQPLRRLQNRPTEPPKSFLNGENPHLNGADIWWGPDGFPEIRHPKSEIQPPLQAVGT